MPIQTRARALLCWCSLRGAGSVAARAVFGHCLPNQETNQETVMLKFRSPVVLQLQDGELLPLDGLWLSVVRGRVWITQACDPDDHFLDAGQSMRLPRGARALLSAEGPAQIALAARTYTPQPRR